MTGLGPIAELRAGKQTVAMVTGMGPSSANSPLLVGSLRVRQVAGTVSMLALVCTGILALAAVFYHQAILGTAALGALVTCGFANGVIEMWRGYFLWHTGAWAGLSGQRFTREQQPARFVVWITMHLLIAMVWIGVAGYLTGTLAQRL
ncbi:MAG TPA: hypothetical protein VHN39_17160 [Phenylobacterium sp.]|jgi:hypothetical protein|nr:hypothetical protein [Phenylobacterium sp.]